MNENHRKWIAFDAAGTLFEPAEPVEDIYADCFSTLGFGIPESTWKKAFESAFSITPDPIYRTEVDWNAVEKEWWRDLVRRAADAAGIRPDHLTMTQAFDELYEHYAAGSAWRLFPETLATLSLLREKGIGLAIASNFDSRLHGILRDLGIAGHFDLVITSADAGARKPSPRILEKLLSSADCAPSVCCLAGDSLSADKAAAEAAGIAFFHIHRPSADLARFADWHQRTFFPKMSLPISAPIP